MSSSRIEEKSTTNNNIPGIEQNTFDSKEDPLFDEKIVLSAEALDDILSYAGSLGLTLKNSIDTFPDINNLSRLEVNILAGMADVSSSLLDSFVCFLTTKAMFERQNQRLRHQAEKEAWAVSNVSMGTFALGATVLNFLGDHANDFHMDKIAQAVLTSPELITFTGVGLAAIAWGATVYAGVKWHRAIKKSTDPLYLLEDRVKKYERLTKRIAKLDEKEKNIHEKKLNSLKDQISALAKCSGDLHAPSRSPKYMLLDSMPMGRSLRSGEIYLQCIEKGLQYKVTGLDGKLKDNTISWDQFPKDFPRELSKIKSNEDCLLAILNQTSKAGHTHFPLKEKINKIDSTILTSKPLSHEKEFAKQLMENQEEKAKVRGVQFFATLGTAIGLTMIVCASLAPAVALIGGIILSVAAFAKIGLMAHNLVVGKLARDQKREAIIKEIMKEKEFAAVPHFSNNNRPLTDEERMKLFVASKNRQKDEESMTDDNFYKYVLAKPNDLMTRERDKYFKLTEKAYDAYLDKEILKEVFNSDNKAQTKEKTEDQTEDQKKKQEKEFEIFTNNLSDQDKQKIITRHARSSYSFFSRKVDGEETKSVDEKIPTFRSV